MIRKSFVSAHDAELAGYRSAFVRLGGARWRAPVVYELADAPDGSSHLFVEDVGTVARAPVGTDLAQLLQVPNRLVDGRPRLPAECVAAYGRGLRRSAGSAAPSDEDTEVGYLFRMMSGSLRWQIHQLRTARSWPGLTENLSRLTRDGERLLELVGR